MYDLLKYPHFIILAIIVTATTEIAGCISEERRGHFPVGYHLSPDILLAMPVYMFYCLFAYLFPTFIFVIVFDLIFSIPTIITFNMFNNKIIQFATLFATGANFADLASTYGKSNFWRHIREYFIFVPLSYYLTMILTFFVSHILAFLLQFLSINAHLAYKLFAIPSITSQTWLNLLIFISLFLTEGLVSYFLRKSGEQRGYMY